MSTPVIDLDAILAQEQHGGAAPPIDLDAKLAAEAAPAPGREFREGELLGAPGPVGPINVGAVTGALKGIPRSVLGGAKALGSVLGVKTPGIERLRDDLAPATPQEAKGQHIEQMLEFLVPGLKAKGLLGKVAAGALESGAVGAAQSGEVGKEAATAAKFGAAGPVVGKLAGAAGTVLRNRALKPLLELMKFGEGEADKATEAASHLVRGTKKIPTSMVDVGNLVSTTKAGLAAKLQGLADTAGETIRGAKAAAPVSFVPINDVIKRAEAEVERGLLAGGQIAGDARVVRNARKELATLQQLKAHYGDYVPTTEIDKLRDLKDYVYESVKGRANDLGSASAAQAAKKTGDSLRHELALNDPEMAELNQDYHLKQTGATMAKGAADAGVGKPGSQVGGYLTARRMFSGLASAAGGVGGYVAGGIPGAMAGALAPLEAIRLWNSPFRKTLSVASQEVVGRLFQSGQVQAAADLLSRLMASSGGDLAASTVGDQAASDPRRLPVTDDDLEFERRMQAQR